MSRTWLMNISRTCAAWGLVMVAILFSPIVVIFLIPLAIGVGFDVFELVGETPFVLLLCAPFAFVLLRLVSLRSMARQLAVLLRPRLPLARAN